ncbi:MULTISPECIES: uroporphyrinogen-III C-methyltransferase [unclassified Pseudoalteromonas]|uniref:uroporphyrinogen-III C-methyltransferase n=1 Tax=unclassified Pseudoalteromonas TaxID=194690 RepID=UPI001F3DBA55|nr:MULTISPECIES: uroporphyrinogen-III C-methyltransferase [unclassified Pseudoalteromonas]MCF2829313.1 uroporphyrinogen-III synthase [Pseudoalteromonas sp. OF5H-5]MCF2830412.1 uroporphyrinogen-III synthase [Pseudoalteromonas sp. DL2-H6]MCF2926892.1 uroporphyrinogen-III synthase [Pseudoalteromonas sp. DL2-H1]
MKVVLTRPVGKSEPLSELLTQQQISSVICPVLQLNEVAVSDTAKAMISEAELAIFVSPDAVRYFHQLEVPLAGHCAAFAVGEGTADAIQQTLNIKAKYPKQPDSEGLLALPQLSSVEGKRVLLVKGKGGRPVIAQTLKARGAILDSLVVYERVAVKDNADGWLDHWRSQQIEGIVITSNSAADAIFNTQSSASKDWLAQRTFFVVSQRIAEHVQQSYNIEQSQIVVCHGPDNRAIAGSIIDYTKQQGRKMTQSESQTKNTNTQQAAKAAEQTVTPHHAKAGVSKVALLALLVALGSGAGAGYVYLQQQQQLQQALLANQAINAENQLLNTQLSGTKSQLQRVENVLDSLQDNVAKRLAEQQQHVETQLTQTLAKAQQQVSGAVASEALYLQRLAAFKVAAEQDYLGAIAILQRLQESLESESNTAAVKQAIAKDIAALKALPKPQTESLYFELHGLLSQVDTLTIKTKQIPQKAASEDAALSQQVDDWQANLKRSWQGLVDDFITIRHHDEVVIDPLLDKNEQLLIRTQLRAYLTQAQTALIDQQASIYFSALDSAADTLARYFDTQHAPVSAMQQALNKLSRSEVQRQEPIELATPAAVKGWLK